jgi:hypothetical protein
MLQDYQKELYSLINWYEKTKELVIEAESFDSNNSCYIQPLHELRYSYDHLIRAFVLDINGANSDIIQKALYSAKSHLQRAYSDSIEWFWISVKEKYITTLAPFTSDQIALGFPDYYSKIRPSMNQFNHIINEYKISKNSETNLDLQKLDDISHQYIKLNLPETLKEYLELLEYHENILLEIKHKDKKAIFRDKLLLPFITGLITAILSGFIVSFISH